MTQYIYMNERIRQRKPGGPVIVAQDDIYGSPRVREANEFELWHHGEKIGRVLFRTAGLDAVETHEVKAWVELDDMVIVADPTKTTAAPKKPVASEKKPGRAVRT